MKYSCELEIKLPRTRVIELFDNPDNLSKWQPGLLRFEPLSGTPGQPHAKSKLTYRQGKGEFVLIETITVRDLPDEFSGTYESKLGTSTVRNRFVESGTSTRWLLDTEFQGVGIMKLLAPLMSGAIRKETLKMGKAFKIFAESQSH
jgi:hypothetical protein